MSNKRIALGEGIGLLHIASKKFKTIHIALLFRRRLNRAEVTKNALLPPILKRGARRYPTLSAINTRADSLYGAIFDSDILKKGEEQILQFYLEVLDGSVDPSLLYDGLELLRDVTLDPLTEGGGFQKEYVAQEKENLKTKIESRVNDKKEYAKLRLIECMCKDEPFGLYGDGYAEDLAAVDAENLYRHYQTVLAESPIDFIVIGDCDTEALAGHIKALFHMKRSAVKATPSAELRFDPAAERKEITEPADVHQEKLCIGLRCGCAPAGDAFYALLVLNELFGGGPESKLFADIREKQSLCYYINSFLYRFKSILCVESGVEPGDAKKTADLVLKQLEALKTGDFDGADVKKAVQTLTKQYTGIYDYPQGVMDFYHAEKMLGQTGGIAETVERIKKVEKDAVVTVAAGIYPDTVYLLSSTQKEGQPNE
ncbi:MAG: insulinase family protein [Clostridiales bacterium]|jgi:predicted Zn-dependent peptidase|nr:insulinase family protein [Clostridiales bacterium]